jgi:hypothetical protein
MLFQTDVWFCLGDFCSSEIRCLYTVRLKGKTSLAPVSAPHFTGRLNGKNPAL